LGERESGEGTGGVGRAAEADAVGVVGLRGPVGVTVEDGVATGEWVVVAGEWGAVVGGDGVGQAEVGGTWGSGGGGSEAPGTGIRGGLTIRGGCAGLGAVWTGSSVAMGV
jgi:hypothetical protein